MITALSLSKPPGRLSWLVLIVSGIVVLGLATSWVDAGTVEVDGFTEPNRTINVAAAETGIVERIQVREGDVVHAGQPLATLDKEIHLALLAIAEKSMEARGRLDSALAELQLKQERLSKFEDLRIGGHARQEEVDRARAEVQVAEANLRSAEEDVLIRKLEYEKIKAQLDRRTIRSPIAGVVAKLHKEEGEFVAPNTPDILTLVELDPLVASFSVLSPLAQQIHAGQAIAIHFPDGGRSARGVVEFISPVTDAESGTVRVRLRIANPNGEYRSGEHCLIRVRSRDGS